MDNTRAFPLIAALVVALLPTFLASAQEARLIIGTQTAELGDTEASVDVVLETNGTAPSTLVLGVTFDPESLGFLDAEPGPAVTAAGKSVRSNLVAGGESTEMRFALVTIPDTPQPPADTALEDGVLLTLTFAVLGGEEGDVLAINPVNLSASDATATPIVITGEPGWVAIGDVSPEKPSAPANVTASSGYSDGVLVEWSAVAGDGIEYRVYRSDTMDIASATPLGETWTTGLAWLDRTARRPSVSAAQGCAGESTVVYRRHYYWVRARNEQGLQSDPSAVAMGYRQPDPSAASSLSLMGAAGLLGLWGIIRRKRPPCTPH